MTSYHSSASDLASSARDGLHEAAAVASRVVAAALADGPEEDHPEEDHPEEDHPEEDHPQEAIWVAHGQQREER